MINLENKQTEIPIHEAGIKKDAQHILGILNYNDFDLGIWILNPKEMAGYNKEFRNKDKTTDVLSFPYHTELKAGERIVPKDEDDKNLGDIMLCPEYVKTDLPNWEQSFEHRMRVLLVHSICHLLGYDHETDADHEVMQKLEDRLLEKLEKGTHECTPCACDQ